jgi:hypothetical protein
MPRKLGYQFPAHCIIRCSNVENLSEPLIDADYKIPQKNKP